MPTKKSIPREIFSAAMEQMMAKRFAALGDSKRLRIICMLTDHPCQSVELQKALGCSAANVWTHLSVLKSAGLVDAHREGNNLFYSLADSFAGDLMSRVLEKVRERHEKMALAVA